MKRTAEIIVQPLADHAGSVLSEHVLTDELVAHYTDRSSDLRQLIPPYSFRCRYELVSLNRNVYRPKLTPAGLDLGPGKRERGAHAEPSEIVDLPLDPLKSVERIEVRSVSSESLIAIFGLTFVRSE